MQEPSAALRRIEDFELRDGRGKTYRLADLTGKPVVVVAFVGTECPLAKLYVATLEELAQRYAERGVAVLAIDANVQDSASELVEFEKKHRLSYPVLKDPGASVADRFGAQRTPEVFVLDAERVVRYRGPLDDQFGTGYRRPQPTRTYAVDAIEAVLAGREVAQPLVAATGCVIGRPVEPAPDADVTYAEHVAPILNRRCVECHHAGDIAPFARTSYDEASGWAETIAEVVAEGRMPPWHANPAYGKFSNDPRLSDEEKRLIERWVELGAPPGDLARAPEPPALAEGWRIGEPDQIVRATQEPFPVPARGEVPYQYFVVDPGFEEDKWIKAAECKYGAREVVHHIIIFLEPPRRSDDDPPGSRALAMPNTIESVWFLGTAPGAKPLSLPDGMAQLVPAGSKFVFQVHYTTNGTPQEDSSQLGLVFADPRTVVKEVGTWHAASDFVIPPGEANHVVRSSHEFVRDTLVLTLLPHMHVRGKSFRYEAVQPDGRREVLLDVPRFDFGWQTTYILAEPKLMPIGSSIECTAVFDNSSDNRSNPDPTAEVRWGEQSSDEMMVGYFSMVLVDQDLTQPPRVGRRTDDFNARLAAGKGPSLDAQLQRLASIALESSDAFNRFARALDRDLPQLDSLDWIVVEDDKLVIELASQRPFGRLFNGGPGTVTRASGKALAGYASAGRTVTHSDLRSADAIDLRQRARLMSSSVHVPIARAGRRGLISFWSAESDAFPPEAVAFLELLVGSMK